MALWILPVIAPLTVAFCLLGLHSAVAVFVLYHGVICIGGTLVFGRRADLGLRARRGLTVGLVLGAVMAAGTVAAHALLPDLFPTTAQLREILLQWRLDPDHPGALLAFMALVNGPAEELFWRGFLQDRLLRGWRSGTVLVLLFTSYHAITVGDLAPDLLGMLIMLSGVAGAAVFWTWSRRRWNSLWPALLSHTGAAVGYMIICLKLLG